MSLLNHRNLCRFKKGLLLRQKGVCNSGESTWHNFKLTERKLLLGFNII